MKYNYFKVFTQKYVMNLKIIRTNTSYLHDLRTFGKLIMKCEWFKNYSRNKMKNCKSQKQKFVTWFLNSPI